MHKVYQNFQPAHEFIFLRDINTKILDESKCKDVKLKTYARLVKLIGKNELLTSMASVSEYKSSDFVFILSDIKDCLSSITPVTKSNIAIFEDDERYIIVDLSNINISDKDISQPCMIFGILKRIEKGIPVLIAHVLSYTGSKSKEVIENSIQLLTAYQSNFELSPIPQK